MRREMHRLHATGKGWFRWLSRSLPESCKRLNMRLAEGTHSNAFYDFCTDPGKMPGGIFRGNSKSDNVGEPDEARAKQMRYRFNYWLHIDLDPAEMKLRVTIYLTQ